MIKRYIHCFSTEAEFDVERSDRYIEPWLSYTEDVERVDYNKPDYLSMPLTMEFLGQGSVSWALGDMTVEYSRNGRTWMTMDSGTSVQVASGDVVSFRGSNESYCGNTFSSTARFEVYGNIMSLVVPEGFATASTLGNRCFCYLFNECSTLVSAGNLQMPATSMGTYCYQYMFHSCTAMTDAPELPSTTLSSGCYNNMFMGCSNLVKAPELPATALAQYCYAAMFRGCQKLSRIKAMFINLTPTNAVANWVNGVAGSGTFVKNSLATWTTTGNNGIPTGWTVETADS